MGRLAFALLLVALAGCPQEKSDAGFKVALVTPGSITDQGWNALAAEGIERVEKELGVKTEKSEQKDASKFEDTLKDYALRGANVVFAHGFEFQAVCEKVGAKFPNTVFIVAAGDHPFANGAPIKLKLDEAFYLAGMLSASLSKTKKLGCVGGLDAPAISSGFKAFERGARTIAKDATVTSVYVGNFEDAAKGKELAFALIAQGVDVIVHNADHAGLGVFEAAKEKGALAIGSNRDQNGDASGVVVASATVDIPRCMVELAREVKENRFKPRDVLLDMKSGYVDLKIAPKTAVADDVRKAIEDAKKAILAGTLDPAKD